jgi:hypothetical protein
LRWAGWLFKKWCARAMLSTLRPMKKFVGTLRNHEDPLMNYFKANKLYSSGIVEGAHSRQVKARMPDSTGDFRIRLSRSTCLGSGSNAINYAKSRDLISRTARRS